MNPSSVCHTSFLLNVTTRLVFTNTAIPNCIMPSTLHSPYATVFKMSTDRHFQSRISTACMRHKRIKIIKCEGWETRYFDLILRVAMPDLESSSLSWHRDTEQDLLASCSNEARYDDVARKKNITKKLRKCFECFLWMQSSMAAAAITGTKWADAS